MVTSIPKKQHYKEVRMVFELIMTSRWAIVETAEHSNLFLIRNRK